MAFKVPLIILTLTLILMITKYWKAKEEKDNCYLNLDNHIKYIREIKTEANENQSSLERSIKIQESEIETIKQEKITAESKFRLCDNQNENQRTEIR